MLLEENNIVVEKKKDRKKGFLKFTQLVAAGLIGSIISFGIFSFVKPETIVQSNALPAAKTASVQNSDSNIYTKLSDITQPESVVTNVADKVSPSIVGISVQFVSNDFFSGQNQSSDEGSGIIIRNDGYILTNFHVVSDAINKSTKAISSGSGIDVYLPNQQNTPYKATYIGGDSNTDLAVIKINATDLPVAELGDSDKIKVGELAVAIGNPGGLEFMGSVTAGVISGLNRTIEGEGNSQMKLIQTDAAINPGNSGGALINSQGQIIGVNSAKIEETGFEGIGFAIPINTAKEIANQLITNKYVPGRPLLGISIDTRYNNQIAKVNKLPNGVLVQEVTLLSGADKAGVKSGDIITKFNGQALTSFSDLEAQMSKHKPGDVVTLTVYRKGSTLTLSVTLTEDKG
ncbi:MAG: trypsin-like peptidase domain-containing protein [Bacillota bacterium]|nr:trypsin-like peptidase domain-containing protein [Bacillota bacterium]